MDHSLSIKRPITSFRSGGHVAKRSRFLENGVTNMEVKVESQPSKGDKVKVMSEASDLDSRVTDSVKAGIAAHTRKSNDSPAVVPIKKRRIQILESRSPSPPPSSPSRQPQSIPPELPPPCGETHVPMSSNSSLLGFSSASSPRSSVPIPRPSAMSQACVPPASHVQLLACEGGHAKPLGKADSADIGKLVAKEQPIKSAGNCDDIEDNISAQQSCIDDVNGHVLPDTVMDQAHVQVKLDGQLIRSESDSFSRDDRLHWDLNTDMAAWDASCEQVALKISEGKDSAASHPRPLSGNPSGTNQDQKDEACDEDAKEHLEEETDYGEEEPEDRKVVFEEEPEGIKAIIEEEPEGKNGVAEEEQHTGEEVVEELEMGEQGVDDPEMGKQVEEDPEMGEQVEEDPEMGKQMDEEGDIIEQDFSGNSEHTDIDKEEATPPPSVHMQGALNAPDAADFPEKPGSWDGDLSSDGRDGNELSEAHFHQEDMPERLKSGKQGKSSSEDAEGWNYEPEFEEHVDYGDSDCRDADDPGLDGDDRTSLMQEESDWKVEDGTRSRKVTPCEGETSIAGETLKPPLPDVGQPSSEPSLERPKPSGRSRTTGWDQLPEGFESAEEALRAAKEGSARRGGRGGSWGSLAGRGSLHSAGRFGPPTSIRNNTRNGFSNARGDGYYGDRHPDEYDRDGYRHGRRVDDSFNVRGRDPARRPGMFGRGRAGGWMDSQPGHMNQWGPGRHRPGSGFSGPSNAVPASAARVENSGFGVAPDGTMTKHGMGPGRGGIRSTVGGGRVGRGGHVRGPPVDMDGGVHYPLRAGAGSDRVAGLGPGAGPGYSGGLHDRSGRGMMDRYRGGGLDSRRSMSPRRQHTLDHPNMMGRMPGMRPDSRVVTSRTPPLTHRSAGSSDFNALRNQRSPPPSSRWLSDKREADSYQDRDFKRPLSRARVPSQRTSPHVVHGSSLTDERDRQVLAVSRHSPPVKSAVAPAHLRKSKDDSLDPRPSKRLEEEDARYTGSFAKDVEYRRSSPIRESDKEREKGALYRRERDRDDERRRDFRRSSSRDGRFPGGLKHASARETDDDIAPRRRRPS